MKLINLMLTRWCAFLVAVTAEFPNSSTPAPSIGSQATQSKDSSNAVPTMGSQTTPYYKASSNAACSIPITSSSECQTATNQLGGTWDGNRNWADRCYGCLWSLIDEQVNFNTDASGKCEHADQIPVCNSEAVKAGLPAHVTNCGGGWFSKLTHPNVDSSAICDAYGYTGIDKFGGNWGRLCSQSDDGNGNCAWNPGTASCGKHVDWHCTGQAIPTTTAETTTTLRLTTTTMTTTKTMTTSMDSFCGIDSVSCPVGPAWPTLKYVVLGSDGDPQCEFSIGSQRVAVEVSMQKCNVTRTFIGNSFWEIVTLHPVLPPVVPLNWKADHVVCSCKTKRDKEVGGDWQVSTTNPGVANLFAKGELRVRFDFSAVTQQGNVVIAPGSQLPIDTGRFLLEARVLNVDLAGTFSSCVASPTSHKSHPNAVTLLSDFCLGKGWDQRYESTTSNLTRFSSYPFIFSNSSSLFIMCTIMTCDILPCGVCGQRLRRLQTARDIDVSVMVHMSPSSTEEKGWPRTALPGGQSQVFQAGETIWQSYPAVTNFHGFVTMSVPDSLAIITPSSRRILSGALSGAVQSFTNRSVDINIVHMSVLQVTPLRVRGDFEANWPRDNVEGQEEWASLCDTFGKASREAVTDALTEAFENTTLSTSAFEQVQLLLGNAHSEPASDSSDSEQGTRVNFWTFLALGLGLITLGM